MYIYMMVLGVLAVMTFLYQLRCYLGFDVPEVEVTELICSTS